MGRRVARLAAAVAMLLALAQPASADEGWTIETFASGIDIQRDGSFRVTERIDVDFGSLSKHGIFRYVPYRYRYDDTRDRVYGLTVLDVSANSAAARYEESRDRGNVVLKIGDPNRTVSGRQSYVIRYVVRNGLNPFADHDELYWNVKGSGWDVPARQVSATVTLPAAGVSRIACYQGAAGSTDPCNSSNAASGASFSATHGLRSGDDLTIVVGITKGVVAEPTLDLQPAERDASDPGSLFTASPATLGATAFVLVAGLALVATNWYARGRDHVYVTNYYLTNDPREDVRPLIGGQTIAPEYEPPEKLRPAEAGLLLDESVDPKDATATIIDLASRGYIKITELPKQFFFVRDWSLQKTKSPGGSDLAEYERLIFDGLFKDGDTVKLSDLRGHFYTTLHAAQKALYAESARKDWFIGNPQSARARWAGIGCLVLLLGGVLAIGLGFALGGGLVGLAVAFVGLVLLVFSHAMSARSAKGSDLLRRFLGFRMYMLTAERDRQKFAEKEGLFSEYLPYAIVFGIVDRWANAFRGLDERATGTAAWYVGTQPFNAWTFSSDLQSFSHSLSLSVASTPGGSGGSGFGGGGSSGGGGGGGGGGSW